MGTQGVIVGRVIRVREHPHGDRIWLADVDLGRGSPVQIVFGGVRQVIQPDSLVPVAPPGSRLHGVKMRKRTYRGEASHGMLCSLAELGWDLAVTDRVARLVPSADLKPGTGLDNHASDWQSLILNPRAQRAGGVLTVTRQVLSGEWHLGKRGVLRRRRVRQGA